MRWWICPILVLPLFLSAQGPVAVLDTAVIRVGEQAGLELKVTLPDPSVSLQWPAVGDTLSRNIEVISYGEVDTIHASAGTPMELVRRLVITSFDTGFWAIAPFKFTIAGDHAETGPLLLEVRTVDLGADPILRDIKPIHEVPFSLTDWLARHWWYIAGLVIAGLLVWWIIGRFARRRRTAPLPVVEQAVLPLHERIIRALNDLDAQRVWQRGEHKEYHSRLTDLLRAYIEEGYGIPALERTTDELMQELRLSPMAREHQAQLRNMLQLADMVKFAKAVPTGIENEQMMQAAIRFVSSTARTAVQHETTDA